MISRPATGYFNPRNTNHKTKRPMNFACKLLLFAGLAGLPFAPTAAQEPRTGKGNTAAEKPIVVPFELLKTGHMAVEVKVNGKGPYRLIFDTGAPTNLVNNRLARDAGLLKKDDKPAALFGISMGKAMDTLEIGGVKLEKVPTTIADHPTVTAFNKAMGPIEGIIGFPFFARYKTTVDYQKKELTLVPNGYVPGDVTKVLMDKLMSGTKGKSEPTVVSPAAVWGFTVDKAAADEDAGVAVKAVVAGGPAAAGGLKAGDRLLTLDGRWTDSVGDTFTAASLVKPGRAVTLVVERAGKEVKLSVKPAKGV